MIILNIETTAKLIDMIHEIEDKFWLKVIFVLTNKQWKMWEISRYYGFCAKFADVEICEAQTRGTSVNSIAGSLSLNFFCLFCQELKLFFQ